MFLVYSVVKGRTLTVGAFQCRHKAEDFVIHNKNVMPMHQTWIVYLSCN